MAEDSPPPVFVPDWGCDGSFPGASMPKTNAGTPEGESVASGHGGSDCGSDAAATASGHGSSAAAHECPAQLGFLSDERRKDRVWPLLVSKRNPKTSIATTSGQGFETPAASDASGQCSHIQFSLDIEASGQCAHSVEKYFSKYDARCTALAHSSGYLAQLDAGVLEAASKRVMVSAFGHGPLGPNHRYRKADKQAYNRHSPMTLILPKPMVWVGGIDAATTYNIHRNAGVKTIWTVADLRLGRLNKHVRYLAQIDMNMVTEGQIPFQEFLKALIEFDEAAEFSGSALVHCLQGANRSGAVIAAYITAKCRVPIATALRYVQDLRSIIDLSEAKHGNFVLPEGFLRRHEKDLHDAFLGRRIVQLPDVVSPTVFKSMVLMEDINNRAIRAKIAAASGHGFNENHEQLQEDHKQLQDEFQKNCKLSKQA